MAKTVVGKNYASLMFFDSGGGLLFEIKKFAVNQQDKFCSIIEHAMILFRTEYPEFIGEVKVIVGLQCKVLETKKVS